MRTVPWLLLVFAAASPLSAQETAPPRPAPSDAAPEGPYPARLLTIESGAVLEPGGTVGLGDTRWSLPGVLLELTTNTLGDALGVANAGVKVGLLEESGIRPAVAVGARGYWSYGGLIDVGVRHAVESFANVTDSEVDLSGWTAHATATWTVDAGRGHAHASVQTHRPLESKFLVRDSEAGGGGSVEFLNGDDVSVMGGLDRSFVGGALIVLAEAGYSWGLERPRWGAGVNVGTIRWRAVVGAIGPGVETDLATDATDFVVSPVFSLHYRF